MELRAVRKKKCKFHLSLFLFPRGTLPLTHPPSVRPSRREICASSRNSVKIETNETEEDLVGGRKEGGLKERWRWMEGARREREGGTW